MGIHSPPLPPRVSASNVKCYYKHSQSVTNCLSSPFIVHATFFSTQIPCLLLHPWLAFRHITIGFMTVPHSKTLPVTSLTQLWTGERATRSWSDNKIVPFLGSLESALRRNAFSSMITPLSRWKTSCFCSLWLTTGCDVMILIWHKSRMLANIYV